MAQQQQRYRVIERIASGGMAEVFRAESAGLEGFKKNVAIKRVLPHLSEKKQFIAMFLDEARLSAHLSHSNCVQVFDIGVGDNTYFIVMEFVDGANLKAIIEHRQDDGAATFPVEAACLHRASRSARASPTRTSSPTTNGSAAATSCTATCRRRTCSSRSYGEVKIVDFGLAKANSQLEKSEPGIIKGKFSYLSPEAAMGEPVDPRTDIFAVGIILWELLAGQRLFLGETDFETVKQVQAARVPSLSQLNPEVTPELERIVQKALARDPTERYQTARDLGRDLNAHLFRIGHAVSSFDIAQLVARPIVAARRRAPPQAQGRQGLDHRLVDRRGHGRVHVARLARARQERGRRSRGHGSRRRFAAQSRFVRGRSGLGPRLDMGRARTTVSVPEPHGTPTRRAISPRSKTRTICSASDSGSDASDVARRRRVVPAAPVPTGTRTAPEHGQRPPRPPRPPRVAEDLPR